MQTWAAGSKRGEGKSGDREETNQGEERGRGEKKMEEQVRVEQDAQ